MRTNPLSAILPDHIQCEDRRENPKNNATDRCDIVFTGGCRICVCEGKRGGNSETGVCMVAMLGFVNRIHVSDIEWI